MPSLDDHFRALTTIPTPTAWPELGGREPHASAPLPARRSRAGVAALAFAVAVAGLVFAIHAFQPGSRPTERAATPNGTITVPAHAIPEGTLLVQTEAGAEMLRAGSETSDLVADVHAPLDLSPDGATLLASTAITGSSADELVLVDLRSGARHRLVHPANGDFVGAFARWSPDGSMVAYVVGARDPADRSELCVIARTRTDPRCFPDAGRVYDFDWAPDGGRLVVAGPPAQPVRILDVSTGTVSEVIPQEGDTPINDAIRRAGLGTSFQLVSPKWSPSGMYLAALANLRDPSFGYVAVVFTPDGRFVALGRASGEFPEPFEWSPQVDVLAYTRGEAPYRITEAYVLDPASGKERILATGYEAGPFVITGIAWAPSGRWLALGGWVDLGAGHFRTALGVLAPDDPTSFQPVPIDTGEVTKFLADWGP